MTLGLSGRERGTLLLLDSLAAGIPQAKRAAHLRLCRLKSGEIPGRRIIGR